MKLCSLVVEARKVENMRIAAALLCVLLCGQDGSRAEDSPTAYGHALAALEAQSRMTATSKHIDGMSELTADLYQRAQQECVSEGSGSVQLIVRIDDGGTVGNVVGNPEGPTAQCYRGILLQTLFPSPPFAPFYTSLLMHDPKPQYDERSTPDTAGSVVLAILVGKDGRVKDGRIVESSGHPQLDERMLKEAMLTWRVDPRMEKGKAVEAWGHFRVTVRFEDEVGSSTEAP